MAEPRLDAALRVNRTRRRLTPRILRSEYSAGSLTIFFVDKMDTSRTTATFRVFDPVLGVVEFTEFEWVDDRTLQSV